MKAGHRMDANIMGCPAGFLPSRCSNLDVFSMFGAIHLATVMVNYEVVVGLILEFTRGDI